MAYPTCPGVGPHKGLSDLESGMASPVVPGAVVDVPADLAAQMAAAGAPEILVYAPRNAGYPHPHACWACLAAAGNACGSVVRW